MIGVLPLSISTGMLRICAGCSSSFHLNIAPRDRGNGSTCSFRGGGITAVTALSSTNFRRTQPSCGLHSYCHDMMRDCCRSESTYQLIGRPMLLDKQLIKDAIIRYHSCAATGPSWAYQSESIAALVPVWFISTDPDRKQADPINHLPERQVRHPCYIHLWIG